MARNVTIKFLGDDRDLNRATRSAEDDLDRFSKRAGMVGGVAAGVTTAALNAIGAAARGVTQFIGGAITEAEDAARIARVTAQIIETTGGAAKVTSKHVADLSERIGETAGVDDELVQSAANVLLTFKQVRNEAGKGNKIFDRSMEAASDLSAVWGTDLASSAAQLGKALADPEKGVTKLQRAGVNFTASQREMIKSLVAGGDVLGAQKIILDEVESQVGGAAEANATASQKMAVAWDNFKESVGTAILPAVEAITGYLIDTALPAIERFTEKTIELFGRWGRIIADAFMGVDTAPMDGVAGAVQKIADAAGDVFRTAVDLLKEFGTWCADNAEYIKLAAVALGAFGTSLATISAASKAASAVQSLGHSMGAILVAIGPWGLLAAAIVAIGVGAYYAYTKFEPFRDAVDATWQAMQKFWDIVVGAVQGVIEWFGKLDGTIKVIAGIVAVAFAPILLAIAAVVLAVKHWDTIVDIAQGVWDAIKSAVSAAISFLKNLWAQFGDEIMGIVVALAEMFAAIWARIVEVVTIAWAVIRTATEIVWAMIGPLIEAALIIIRTVIETAVTVIQALWSAFGDNIIRAIQIVFDVIRTIIETALGIIQGIIQIVTGIISGDWSKAWEGIKTILGSVWDGIKGILKSAIDWVTNIWSTLTGLLTKPFETVAATVEGLLEGVANVISGVFEDAVGFLKDGVNTIIDILNAAIRAYNSIPIAPDIDTIPKLRGAPSGASAGVASVSSLSGARTASLMGAMTRAAVPVPVAAGGRPIVINMPEGSNGASVVTALRRYEQRNGGAPGSGWRRR